MRLALKFALILALGIFGVLGVEVAVRVQRELSLFEADMGSDHGALGLWLARAVEQLWLKEGEEGAVSFLKRQGSDERIKVRWIRLDGTEDHPFRPLADPAALETLRRGGTVVLKPDNVTNEQAVHTYVPVSVSPLGAIEIRESLAPQREYVQRTIRTELVTTVTLVILSGSIAVGLGVALIGRPIRELVDKTRRVGAGDLTGRIHIRQRDEIGQLAREINTMSDLLEQAKENARDEAAARFAALEQLRHADRLTTVGKLASGIAHQLGTPLNVIAGRARLIMEEHSSGTPPYQHASAISQEAERMTAIIRQLMDFARRRKADKYSQDLLPIFEATIGMLAPLAEKQRVALSLEESERMIVHADSGLLQQAVINLVMNGIQAMPQGGRLTMSLRRERVEPPPDHGGTESDYARIRIRDEGMGMSADVLKHVMEPFFTTKPIGEGTGLGLSVAYGIIQEHEGWIDIESELGKGSLCSIFLPTDGTA